MHSFQRTYVIYITRHSGCKQIQWNPIFRTLDFSNHGTFSLDLLQSNTVIRFSKPQIFRAISCHPWKKFIINLPSISRICRKVLFSSFHLSRHASGVYSQTQKVEPPSNTQQAWLSCGRCLLYNTIQYNTIQYNTIQYNTIQYNTIKYNTIQYNTIQ